MKIIDMILPNAWIYFGPSNKHPFYVFALCWNDIKLITGQDHDDEYADSIYIKFLPWQLPKFYRLKMPWQDFNDLFHAK